MTQATLGENVGMSEVQVCRLETGLLKATAQRVRPLLEALPVDAVEAASWLERMETRKPVERVCKRPAQNKME
jgi:hypothetical protein